MAIHHSGAHSFIKNITGNLEILGDNLRFRNAAGNKNSITVNNNQDVTLWYNGTSKLSTTSTGINVLGTIVGDGLTVDGHSDLNGDLDVDGHTNLDNVNIAGVVTATRVH